MRTRYRNGAGYADKSPHISHALDRWERCCLLTFIARTAPAQDISRAYWRTTAPSPSPRSEAYLCHPICLGLFRRKRRIDRLWMFYLPNWVHRSSLSDHLKTGQRRSGQNRPTREAGTGIVLLRRILWRQVSFCAPTAGPAFEHMSMMQQSIEHGGDGRGIAE